MRRRPPRRRLVLALVAATVVVAAVDVSGGSATTGLRGVGAAAFGPLERLVGRGGAGALDADDAAAGRVQTGFRTARSVRDLAETRQLHDLLGSPATRGARFVAARVVAVGSQGSAGPERVTIDVGSRDGLTADLTVVNDQGLVGRVTSTGPWTSDVLLVGSAELTVAVRVGEAGTLGSLTGATGGRPRAAGQLSLTLVQRGAVKVGDAATTMGSTGGRPFVAGLPVGRVSSVDPRGGRLAVTAAVSRTVDVTTLDVVGVLLSAPRATPRATVEGTAP